MSKGIPSCPRIMEWKIWPGLTQTYCGHYITSVDVCRSSYPSTLESNFPIPGWAHVAMGNNTQSDIRDFPTAKFLQPDGLKPQTTATHYNLSNTVSTPMVLYMLKYYLLATVWLDLGGSAAPKKKLI